MLTDRYATMLILCAPDKLTQLIEELDQWKGEEVNLLFFGATVKAKQGYLFFRFPKDIQARLQQKLTEEDHVVDFFAF